MNQQIPILQPTQIQAEITAFTVNYIQQLALRFFNITAAAPLTYTLTLPLRHGFLTNEHHPQPMPVQNSPHLTPRMKQAGEIFYSHSIMASELQITAAKHRTLLFGPDLPSLDTYLKFLCLAQIGNRPLNPPHESHYRRLNSDEGNIPASVHRTPFPSNLTVGKNLVSLIQKLKRNTPSEVQLAKSTGISRPTLRKMARNQLPKINMKTVLQVATYAALTDERPLEEVMSRILSVEPLNEYEI